MHDDTALLEGRLARVLSQRLLPAVHPVAVPFDVEVWDVPPAADGFAGEPVPALEALRAPYRPGAVGERWGAPWSTRWLRLTARVPQDWERREVEALIDLGFDRPYPGFVAEGLVHDAAGVPIRGVHPRQTAVPLRDAHPGDVVVLHVEAAANPFVLAGVTELGDRLTAGDEPLYRLARLDLAVRDREVWELVADLEVLGGLARALPREDARRWEVLRAVEQALDELDLQDVAGTAPAARARLAPALAVPARARAHRVSAVGHAHIDSAWLWPLRETVRKVSRTVANVLDLMADHPDLVYAMSSAQQFAWLEEHQPQLFARVREQVDAGRFVPVGGMWVESDSNMPGGEALARQLVHGKRWFLDRFGVETREVWLPDTFGYSAALPQLVALSGSRWFLTQKLSWNQTNRFPHSTFDWEGLDGTRVLTHFPPVDTYNSELTGEELARSATGYADKGRGTRSLVPFGHGDGGGGPTREMLARAERTRDLDGSPRVAVESPARFFEAAEAEYPDRPVWAGELYLEYHRGTYTSQARTKQGNRRSEHLLREAELWCATAAVRLGAEYPYDELDRLWKTVLLHQFHDILPGSSIAWVHREAAETYAAVAARLEDITGTATAALAGSGDEPTVFDAGPFALDAAPAGPPTSVTVDAGGTVLDNGLLQVRVDARGLVVSVLDLAADPPREVVAPGAAAGLLQLHPDLPLTYDAWDVESYYRNRVQDLDAVEALEVLDSGPDVGVRVRRRFGASAVVQEFVLRPGERALELRTEVDWHESERLLKLAFPVDVHALESRAETQFGHVVRAAHENTSWDAARFEICAHRWLHVGEPGYGVALANDGTYGHDVTRHARPGGGTTTTMRASLLRAPRWPDPRTDQGVHRFRHVLVPGAGIEDAARAGYALNLPPRVVPGDGRPAEPLVRLDVRSGLALVEAVKLADDRSGDVVVRVYEALGGRAVAGLVPGFALAGVTVTDLLERPLDVDPSPLDGTELRLRPFQVVTLRLRRA